MTHPTTTKAFLAAVKTAHNITSDYALAKLLGVGRAAVSNWQTGKRQLDTKTCFRVAELLNDQPAAVIAAVELERAEKLADPGEAEEWKGWVKKLGGAAAGVLLALGLGGFSNADAGLRHFIDSDTSYTSYKTRRRRKAGPWDGLRCMALA